MKFTDLKFKKFRSEPSYFNPFAPLILGERAFVEFSNGYGVSVILGHFDDDSWSNGKDTYEVGVINIFEGDMAKEFGEDGVYKYASQKDVEDILNKIELLPKLKKEEKECVFEPLSEETALELLNTLKRIEKL